MFKKIKSIFMKFPIHFKSAPISLFLSKFALFLGSSPSEFLLSTFA